MAKITGQNINQVPSDFSYMPLEACTPNSICTEKLDILLFGCVMIHVITQEYPAVNKEACFKDTEVKKRSKYLNKNGIEVLLKHGHCLQVTDKCLSRALQLCNREMFFTYADKHKIAPHLTKTYFSKTSILQKQYMKSGKDDVKDYRKNPFSHTYLKLKKLYLYLPTKRLQNKKSSLNINSDPNHEETVTDTLLETYKERLNTKETVPSMRQKKSKILQFHIQNTSVPNDNGCYKDDLSAYKILGLVSYSIVYDALCNGQPCAAKANNNEKILQEIKILKSLNHPNVVQFMGVYYHGSTPLLVMEKMWSSLSTWLKTCPSSSHNSKVSILIDVANGLKYLHSQNMIHCDLTANNILLSTNLQAKIGDFGMANVVGQNLVEVPGNSSHMPPEAFPPNPAYTEKLDIFSFGCVMIQTITQEFPAATSSTGTEFDKRSKYLEKIKGWSYMYSIILHCLQNDPSCRPSANVLHYLLKASIVLKSHYYNNELLKYKEVGQGSCSNIYHTLCNKQAYVKKLIYSFIAKNGIKKFKILSLSFLNYTHMLHPTNVHHNKRIMMEKWWMNLSMKLKDNPSTFLLDKVCIITELADGLKYLHLKNICHCGLTADNVLLSIKLQTKICDLDENASFVTNDPAIMPASTWSCNACASIFSSSLNNEMNSEDADKIVTFGIQVFSLTMYINSLKSAEHSNALISGLYCFPEISTYSVQFKFDLLASSISNDLFDILHNYTTLVLLEKYYLSQNVYTQYGGFTDFKQHNSLLYSVKSQTWCEWTFPLLPSPRNYRFITVEVPQLAKENLLKDYSNDDKLSTPCEAVNSSSQHNKDIMYVSTTQRSHLHVFEETNSEANFDTCVNDLYESLDFRVNSCYVESESFDSLYRCASSNTLFLSNSFVESISITGQESFQHFVKPSESISVSVIGQRIYSPLHAVPSIPCSNLSVNETVLQRGVLFKKENNRTRGFGDGSDSSSSDEDNNGEDKRGIHTSLVSHYHSPNPQQHSLPTDTPRYKSLSAAVNTSLTPQTSTGTGLISTKHDGRLREVATTKPFMGVGVTFPNSPAMYTSKGEYLINDSLTERGPILLDIPNGHNELVMAAYSTQSIPKLYPIVGLRKELPGIALPPPIPLDLPKIHSSKKVTNVASHQQVVREQPVGTVPGTVPGSNVQKPQPHMASVVSYQQQAPLSQSMDFSDPVSIIGRAALLLTAGDYGATIKVLEVLDKHLVLPDDIDMAKEFGQGLANYKNLHYRAAKPCFNALFEKSINYCSPGNQAVASIYLGEIEMSWAKYKDAEKHFTLAVTNYSPDNVAEKFQQTILTKSAVLVKKGQCHRSLSQIKEAINAFKMAKEVAESAQEQARGSKLKTAKEDELSAVCALGNILQSIGDYEQSFEYYEKSLKLAGELGDHVSIGWAHGNLGNAMLGLDQKDKALDHLITAFHMSARYEGNPLAVGRAVSNLGNAYQAIGNLEKAKEHYELALGHAIYGNDLQGQGRACGNVGNVYMLLKEPVKAVHYYTETLRLSTDRNTKITGHHNRGCARFDVAKCIIQGKKPKELVPAKTQDSEYGRLVIKLTDEVITTDPVQETKPNREPSAQSVSEQKESSVSIEMLPVMIKGKVYEGIASVEIIQMAEALLFLETAQHDLLEAIDSHEQCVKNVKGSHEALSLSLSLFQSNSRSFYKMQETLVELGKLCQRLSQLGLMDMAATEPQEYKDALVYGEQARARTLGELVLQKKKMVYSDLFSISTPLTIQDIYKTVKLQKFPVVFLSYCISKLLMWILVPVNDEVVMRCQSIELKEDLENSSFELYIRYNLLQFLSKDKIYIFRRCAYEQESPFTVLHDVIAIKIIEGLKSVGYSEVAEFIVIPDSVTHLLPFSPLMNKSNWQFFGDKYRVRIVPSFLSLLVMSMTGNPVVEIPGDKGDFLIVGNPIIPPFMYDSTQWNLGRLPYAEKEAISVASIIGAIPVLREQATKQSVLYRLRSAKVIHLATHGSASAGFLAFTSSFPVSKSGLAEKEHILIFPKEIETLNISPALVVLSSCDSARGQVKADGVIGMARAFLLAGAHSVLVSLWRVPDESTNVFMNFFYQFLVTGLPSLQALQRSMQCLRCFLKYSHYVHWSGFQIIGKEVTFHKDSNAQFPIHNLLGEVSIFPRQHVKLIEENLLGVRNKIFTDVQLLVGTPGNEPEECARDFIKNCYYYYPCGVYWYDASNVLLLETSVKVAKETPLMGGVYKEQKELDPLPSLLTTKGSKHSSRKEKKLIVLHNFTSLETCACIIREMKDASTDIIIVSNELFCKEEIAKDFDKYFNRGCNIIEVTNLQHISIMQRMVYGLLEKNSFVARDADHIVFTLLSEYSRGATTIVHLLTSLMQKSDDNSRTGFELAKQQLKLHIAHLKLKNSYPTGDRQTMGVMKTMPSLVAGSDDSKQTTSSDATPPPTTAKQGKESLDSAKTHPLYLYINDILSTTRNISLPAHHLLNSLAIIGPIPLPLFYVEELDIVVMNAIFNKGKKKIQAESPMKQLVGAGVIRYSSYPIVYHKDLNPEYLGSSIQLMFVPKLICSAVKDQMDNTDIALAILHVQYALVKILAKLSEIKSNLMHLHYLYTLCNELHNLCLELPELCNMLLDENFKLQEKLCKLCKEPLEDVVCNQEDEVKTTEPVEANTFSIESFEVIVINNTTTATTIPNELSSIVDKTKVPIICFEYDLDVFLVKIFAPSNMGVKMIPFSVPLNESLEHRLVKSFLESGLWQFMKDEKYFKHKFPFNILQKAIGDPIIDCFNSLQTSITQFIAIQQNLAHQIPFSVLQDQHNQKFFEDIYHIKVVPSLKYLINKTSGKLANVPIVEIPGGKNEFLIAGNPTIPPFMYDSEQQNLNSLDYAEEEAISVANITGAIPLLGNKATKEVVLERLQSPSLKVVHLAAHGSNSAILLALSPSTSTEARPEHILITPNDVYGLNLPSVALVVLSFCDSGESQLINNKCIGMASAFLAARAHSVLVSQWKVPDIIGCIFMQFFYQFLVTGLPSLRALQRAKQCMRCFPKYHHLVYWSGFQIIGEEVRFRKKSNVRFPIEIWLGEASVFPRPITQDIKRNLISCKHNTHSDIQLLVGTPGNEPEECARDFIKNCYYYYPCGVYWYDASNKLLLETSVKVANKVKTQLSEGGIYEEKFDDINCKNNKLIVLHNFTTIEICGHILEELKDTSTDIIIIVNNGTSEEEIMKELELLNRKCNTIKVTGLQSVRSIQRIVYGLLRKNPFIPKKNDHNVFELFHDCSQGAATIVHMLTSLMHKCDNDRKGFDCVYEQLQHYSLHRKLQVASDVGDQCTPFQNYHDLCMCINDILEYNLSKPASLLLYCLCLSRSIPLIELYVKELNHLFTTDAHATNEEQTLVKELEKIGVIRNDPYPMSYHKDLDPTSKRTQLVSIPKLICDAIGNNMNDGDRIEMLHFTQQALKNVITHNPNLIQLQYILVLCSQLQDFCNKERSKIADSFSELADQVAHMIQILK